jgi:hypothetical protein
VGAAAAYVLAHPWQIFITDWNWKAALFSAIFRVAVWPTTKAAGIRLTSPGALKGLLIEIAYRLAIGGFWGSLLQAFAGARPAWLGGLSMVVLLPGCAHGLEYLVLRMSGASHPGAITFVSIVFSVASLFVNWGLMRNGILLTGRRGSSLGTDVRRILGAGIRWVPYLRLLFEADESRGACASAGSVLRENGTHEPAKDAALDKLLPRGVGRDQRILPGSVPARE